MSALSAALMSVVFCLRPSARIEQLEPVTDCYDAKLLQRLGRAGRPAIATRADAG